ncbi:MAG: hypothetical protein GQ524_01930 [Anaerolineales bacterium]|nr:hypothetical protein [Anaerolineales bacterium]
MSNSAAVKASTIRQSAKLWSVANMELAEIREDLAATWREAGASGIQEQRALSIGIMIGYLESLMAKQPARIAELGSLYSRLVEGERRAWDASRKHRIAKTAGSSDLAQLANRPD